MINKNLEKWNNFEPLNKELKEELTKMDDSILAEAFFKDIEFGTGGLRGKMGPGTNFLNIYTVRKCAEGYAKWILNKKSYNKNDFIIIAYDNRKNSSNFATEIIAVLSKHGIYTRVFKNLRPTPELSFAIRDMGALGGIVVTASHNTKEYNGIKMYDENVCQCVEEITRQIKRYIESAGDELTITIATESEIKKYNCEIDLDFDVKYINASMNILNYFNGLKKDLKIVYTPQHGTGGTIIPRVLEQMGYEIIICKEQAIFDENFSKTKTPNPEKIESFEQSISYAEGNDADIIIGTDPDCDRVGVMVKHHNKYEMLTGNQLGLIFLYAILTNTQIKSNNYVCNTIVSTSLSNKICNLNGINCYSTLTGFKNIGAKIEELKQENNNEFLYAFEESNGYLFNDLVRDKDGVQTAIAVCKVANYYKEKKMTLLDVLEEIYGIYGYVFELQESISLNINEGAEKVSKIIDKIRGINDKLGKYKIYKKEDYQSLKCNKGTEIEILNYSKSNVIKIYFDEYSWVAIRPSGTEAKIKIYYCIVEKEKKDFRFKNIIELIHEIIAEEK